MNGARDRLINDMILGAGALHIAEPPKIEWFKGIRFIDLLVSLIIPLFAVVIMAFIVKMRYKRKQAREQLALIDFYGHDPWNTSL